MRLAILTSEKIDLKSKTVTREEERHYIIIKGQFSSLAARGFWPGFLVWQGSRLCSAVVHSLWLGRALG